MKILSVDFGYGFTKSIFSNNGNETYYKTPSIVSNFINSSKKEEQITEKVNPIKMDKETFLFGEDVEKAGRKIVLYSREIDFVIKFYPLAIKYTIDKLSINPEEIDYLTIGLPPKDLNKENAEKLKKTILKVKINDNPLPFKEENIYIFGQGQGAFIDTITTNSEIKNGFLLDIGHNTLIAMPFKERKIMPQYKQYNKFGVSGLFDEFLAPLIEEKYKVRIEREHLNKIFITGILPLEKGKKEINKDIKQAITLYLKAIQTKLIEDFKTEIKEADKLIIVGGGSYKIKEHLNKEFQEKIYIPENPEFSNAKGYIKLTKSLIGG